MTGSIVTGVHANVKAGRYDYGKSWPKRRPKFAAFIRARRPDFTTLVECERPHATKLATELGMYLLTYRGSAILWNPLTLDLTRQLGAGPWLPAPQTQSFLFCEMATGTGDVFNLGVSHLPPFAWRAKLRRHQMADLNELTAKWSDPTVLCTDTNWPKTFEAKYHDVWKSARKTAAIRKHDTFRTSGKYAAGDPIDYALLRGNASFLAYDVADGRSWSDHHALTLEVAL